MRSDAIKRLIRHLGAGLRCGALAAVAALLLPWPGMTTPRASTPALVIDEFANASGESALGTRWRVFSDRVMGGVSVPEAAIETVAGRRCLRLAGRVRLENGGGFIQAAVPLAATGVLDASAWDGIELEVNGNAERYSVHLKTADVRRPWAFYAASFMADTGWHTVRLPFRDFEPRAIGTPLAPARLTRIGLVAEGRAFDADLCLAALRLYVTDGAGG